LAVTDLEKSAAYYRRFFGMEATHTKKPERIWFAAAKTRLGLEAAADGKPRIDRISFKVAGFDRKIITERLKKLNVEVLAADEKDVIRFKDPNGFSMELKAAA
jgi:catechol 2,3-dioxygenase-like lactoylglutathione lyase family enzyme